MANWHELTAAGQSSKVRQGERVACSAREGEHGKGHAKGQRRLSTRRHGSTMAVSGDGIKEGRGSTQRVPVCSLAPHEHRAGAYHGKTIMVAEIDDGAKLGGGADDLEL